MKPDPRIVKATNDYFARKDFDDLMDYVDDSTTHITIPTPKGWRCERPNCLSDFLHTHASYPSLEK